MVGFEYDEFGPDIDPHVISARALDCKGRYAGMLGIIFTGTPARQAASIVNFEGPVGIWYFPETPWWSMASASSAIGYLRDEAEANPSLSVSVVHGNTGSEDTAAMLERFAVLRLLLTA